MDDEFVVNYSTNGITAVPGESYQPTIGQIRFARGQNYRYINIPVFSDNTDTTNTFFQVTLNSPHTNNRGATCDITLGSHMGVITGKSTMPRDIHVSVTDDHNCLCHPTPTPMPPDEISIPWSSFAPPVIKHNDICYYKTDICRCDDPCDIMDPQDVYNTCVDCASGGDTLGEVWELCYQIGDVYQRCGDQYDLCGDIYDQCGDQYDVCGDYDIYKICGLSATYEPVSATQTYNMNMTVSPNKSFQLNDHTDTLNK